MTRRLIAAFLVFGLTVASSMVIVLSTGAQDNRTHQIGKKLKCMCRMCNDTAATCSHVGGAFSGPCEASAKGMLKKIDQQVARGDSDDLILQSFVQEYGQVVLMEPPRSGVGRVAWAMPVVYLLVGGVIVVLVISRWRKRPAPAAQTPGAPSGSRISPELLEHARRRVAEETED
jgi:cytochrome c-type biogenesis protein CcmH